MNTIKMTGLACSLISGLFFLSACGQEKKPIENNIVKGDGKGFAVLELFTSEGCSSCPPADKLLAKIQQETKGKAIYILAYHVDYWNRLGWKDTFSNADYSKRQKQYGNWLNAQIYTPQLVVNGKSEFVGSDEQAIRGAIASQLAVHPAATLDLHAVQQGDALKVHYQTTNAVKDSYLLIAIIQKNAQSNVEHGENAGHTLSHVQIVRELKTEPLNESGSGSTEVVLPKGFNTEGWEVIGLLQDPGNGEIAGVAKADLNENGIVKK